MNKKPVKSFLLIFCFFLFGLSRSFSQNNNLDSLLKQLETAQEDTNKVNLLYTIAKGFLYADPDKAMEYNSRGIELAGNLNFAKGKASALDISGIYYQNKGEYDKAEELYQQSLDIRKQINDPNLIANSYNNFGVLNRRKGDFIKSKEFFLKSLEISKGLKDSLLLSRIYNNLGLVTENLGNYEESINYHLQSLEIREKFGTKGDIASSLNNIGLVFLSIEKYDNALEYLLKSLDIKKELNNKRSLASAYANIGNVKFYQDKYGEALDNFKESLDIYKSLGDKKSMAAMLSNLAYVAKVKGDLNLAISYNLKSIDIIKEIGSQDQLCSCYNSISSTYYALKDYKNANHYALMAKTIATKNEDLPQLKSILQSLYLIQTGLGDYKQANQYLEKFIAVKDSLFNETSNKQIFELQTKYETAKKEKEIAQLSELNVLQELKLERRNRMIFVLLGAVLLIIICTIFIILHNKIKQKQKAIELEQTLFRLQMNPHFIFNAISAIQNYIIKNESLEASSYLSSFAKLMRSILKNSGQDLVTLETETQTLEDYLKLQNLRLDGNLNYKIDGISEIDSNEIVIPPMLLQPFIENSIEHGILKKEDQKGNITITFSEIGDNLQIEIVDDGIGREKSGQTKNKDHKSFATEITKSRIKTMKHSYKKGIFFDIIDLKNSENVPVGTKVIFKIPLMSA